MQTVHTSVVARNAVLEANFHTLPHELGWALEALAFVQIQERHPQLQVSGEVSPDGIAWIRHTEVFNMAEGESLIKVPFTLFGNWVRIAIDGMTPDYSAHALIHLVAKG